MRILIVNLTRFGDLLQSQPVIQGLVQSGAEVRMVCLQNFFNASSLLAPVHGSYALPGSAFLSDKEEEWAKPLSAFWQWLSAVREEYKPQAVVNLTPTLPSRLLVRAFAPADSGVDVVGYSVDEFGFVQNGSRWALYLQSACCDRGSSPFNIVDIFRRVAGLPPASGRLQLQAPQGEERHWAARELRALGEPDKGFVGLQLGASEERRRWPVEYFARVGDALAAQGYTPVLLGGPNEEHLGERYASFAGHGYVNFIGRTNLTQLAAVVAELKLLLSNDTGTMHLAAGLDVPVAAIFLATAQPWDTGPYRPNCLCLEPDMDCHPCAFGTHCGSGEPCRKAITPEAVLPSLETYLEQGFWPSRAMHGARAWVTTVDSRGYLDLDRLPPGGLDERTAWIRLQREVFLALLDKDDFSTTPLPGAELSGDFSGDICGQASFSPELVDKLGQSHNLLELLLSQGRLLGAAPRPALKAKFLGFWQRLLATLDDDSRLKVLGTMLVYEMQENGEDLQGLLACLDDYAHVVSGLKAGVESGWHGC